MAATCINCNSHFLKTSDKKGYQRYSCLKIIPGHSVTVGNALERFCTLNIPITPIAKGKGACGPALEDRCLCLICYGALVKIVRGNKLMQEGGEEFRSQTREGYILERQTPTEDMSSLKRKLPSRSPFTTPRRVKKTSHKGYTTSSPATNSCNKDRTSRLQTKGGESH